MHVRAALPERPDPRRDQGGAAAGRRLLRCPGRQLGVRDRAGGAGRGRPRVSRTERTQVGIIGAGHRVLFSRTPTGDKESNPSFWRRGVASIASNGARRRPRARYRQPARADRRRRPNAREGLVHRGIFLRFEESAIIESTWAGSPAGHITVYGQHEVVKDLIAARSPTGQPLKFEVDDVSCTRSSPNSAHPVSPRQASDIDLSATSSPGATDSTASAATASRTAFSPSSHKTIPSPGSAFLPQAPPSREELIYAGTSAASRSTACALRRSPGSISSAP